MIRMKPALFACITVSKRVVPDIVKLEKQNKKGLLSLKQKPKGNKRLPF